MVNITEIANIDTIAKAIIDNNDEGFFFVPWIGKNYEDGLKGKKVLVVGASHYCNHSNICIHPYNNKDCSNYNCLNRCNLGCDYFLDCTSGNTKRYNKDCAWMKKEEYSKSYEILCKDIDKISNCNPIFERLNSTSLGEICDFLDSKCKDSKSFKIFSTFCTDYFFKDQDNKEEKYRSKLWSHIAFVNYSQNFQPNSTGNHFFESDFNSFKKYIGLLKPDVVIVWGCALGGELEKKGFKVNAENNGYNWTKDGIQFVNSYHPSYSGFKDNGHLIGALDKAFQEVSKVTNG